MKPLNATVELRNLVKRLGIILLFGAAIVYSGYDLVRNLKVERNDVSIYIHDPNVAPASLSIAVLGDIHLQEGIGRLKAFRELLLEVKAAEPDLVLFVGDYINNPRENGLPSHRENIIETMKLVDPVPRSIVLGNYESWSNADDWLTDFWRLHVDAMENGVTILETSKGPVCIRGLGDFFTGRFVYVDYPEDCKSIPKLTITHDPAGAFVRQMKGLVIAGHTHCGQVSLPFIGPLWVPTEAPSFAHCGLHQDDEITLFVTSGVGTSILPLRLGTQSQWDMLSLSIN